MSEFPISIPHAWAFMVLLWVLSSLVAYWASGQAFDRSSDERKLPWSERIKMQTWTSFATCAPSFLALYLYLLHDNHVQRGIMSRLSWALIYALLVLGLSVIGGVGGIVGAVRGFPTSRSACQKQASWGVSVAFLLPFALTLLLSR